MVKGVRFSNTLKCHDAALLIERLREMVPTIAEGVETEEGGYRILFADGEAELSFADNLVSIEVEAADAMICQGIKAALAGILNDLLAEAPSNLYWAHEQ